MKFRFVKTYFKIRIGIHIGDVIVEEGDVFGDGVNIASRIENQAEPGGICISERVYYDNKNKPALEATFLGERKLKNVHDPVKIYSLRRGGKSGHTAKAAGAENGKSKRSKIRLYPISLALVGIIIVAISYLLYSRKSDKDIQEPVTTTPAVTEIKSIAVLPFTDMSPDKGQEYFCDGISEAILDEITNISKLRVIARNSSFMFKGTYRDIQAIGDSLDVSGFMGPACEYEHFQRKIRGSAG